MSKVVELTTTESENVQGGRASAASSSASSSVSFYNPVRPVAASTPLPTDMNSAFVASLRPRVA